MSLAPLLAGKQNLFVFLNLPAFSNFVSEQLDSGRTVGVVLFFCLLIALPG